MSDSFTVVLAPGAQDTSTEGEWPNFSPSNLPSQVGSVGVSREPSIPDTSTISRLADAYNDEVGAARNCPEAEGDGEALKLEHVESFNIACVGESGLGKSTFLRDLFAHLDPTKLHALRRKMGAQIDKVRDLEDKIARNEQESRHCDDKTALELREEKQRLKDLLVTEREALGALRQAKHEQERAVRELKAEIKELEGQLGELRSRREAEEDHDAARALGHEVLKQDAALKEKRDHLAQELRRSNLDKDEGSCATPPLGQTMEVTSRLIKEMPLYHGAQQGLDVTLIDTPGYGDLTVDTAANRSADKVVAEVERRISSHLGKEGMATREGMPLDDEKKYWNELVHLCLFFVSPHRMKRADLELMKRLHRLVPLVVVIAKCDTMTREETKRFKYEVVEELRKGEVETFAFDQRTVKEVETRHVLDLQHQQRANGAIDEYDDDGGGEGEGGAMGSFQPLYGGSDGRLPWAVMGSDDESRRQYPWGTAKTTDPRHSELPALRDLLLRANGWQQLKRSAALKADHEGERRKREQLEQEQQRLRGGWGLAQPVLASLARPLVIVALVMIPVAALFLVVTRMATARGDAEAAQAAMVRQLRAQLSLLEDNYAQCTEVRKALAGDLEDASRRLEQFAEQAKVSTGGGKWW